MSESQTTPQEISFTEAMSELDAILRKLQGNDCDIDALTTLTRRATQLIAICRKRLTATDTELRSILATLQSPEK